MYTIASPDEYLAVTGIKIKSIKICKAAWVFPLQRCMRFSVQPVDYAVSLQAMTKEKLQFELPVVFTIGPDVDLATGDSALVKYAMFLADHITDGGKGGKTKAGKTGVGAATAEHTRTVVAGIVKGLIEGETRVLVSSMTMEEIFNGREQFKKLIYKNLQVELDQFGLRIYNCNVRELRDAPGSAYFESLSRKAHEGASNQARIDVAEAQRRGNVGEAQRRGEQERELARISAETAVMKTDRDAERAQAEASLATRRAELDRDVDISRVHARRKIEAEDEALKKDVEAARAAAEMERLRATEVVQATVKREAAQQAADARAYETTATASALLDRRKLEVEADLIRDQQAADAATYSARQAADAAAHSARQAADADAYRVKQSAAARAHQTSTDAGALLERRKIEAEADANRDRKAAEAALYSAQLKADADAYRVRQAAEAAHHAAVRAAEADKFRALQEAEGDAARADALGKMAHALGGPQGLLYYVMVEKGMLVDIAKANAEGVRGLQPKISVWNTGPDAGESDNARPVRDVLKMLPPLMTTVHEQTGMTFPEWQFGKLAAATGEMKLDPNGSSRANESPEKVDGKKGQKAINGHK